MDRINRRFVDEQDAEIDKLIAQEEDPKARLHLVILNRINQSLIANNLTVREISTKLEIHLDAFEKHTTEQAMITNQGKGAWRVLAWALGFVQVAVISAGVYITDEIKALHNDVKEVAIEQARRSERLKFLEDYVSKHTK